jgi:hypothetical protein
MLGIKAKANQPKNTFSNKKWAFAEGIELQ